jgi:aminomethyltransferase
MKYALYGNDIDEKTNPLEAGLGWIVKFNKGDFIGRDALLKVRENGIPRRLVGLRLEGRRIARHGYPVLKDETVVGEIRSGTLSPVSGESIATAYVDKKYRKQGNNLVVDIRGSSVPAVVVKTPFYKNGTHR